MLGGGVTTIATRELVSYHELSISKMGVFPQPFFFCLICEGFSFWHVETKQNISECQDLQA